MRKLNLVDPTHSAIGYKISHFPDGQQQVVLEIGEFVPEQVEIHCRLNNFMDLELLTCAVASLRELRIKHTEARIPYFLGARSDRKFEKGSNNYLKTVICPLVNSLKLDKITVLDPHSTNLEMGLVNFDKEDNQVLITWALRQIASPDARIVSPDEGAGKKIMDVIKDKRIIFASKHRDKDGKFLGFHVPLGADDMDKDLVWIDDIIDGGGTFIGEAEEADKMGHKGKKYLIVTHGIFSAGYDKLMEHFDNIYCTNSYSNVDEVYAPFVKQINIFK